MKKLVYLLITLMFVHCLVLADTANQIKNIDNDIALYWKLENAYQAKCGGDNEKIRDAKYRNYRKEKNDILVPRKEFQARLQRMRATGEICPVDAYNTMVREPLERMRSK